MEKGLPLAGDFYARAGRLVVLWDMNDLFGRVAAGELSVGRTARSTAALYHHPPDAGPPRLLLTLPGNEEAISESSGGVCWTCEGKYPG